MRFLAILVKKTMSTKIRMLAKSFNKEGRNLLTAKIIITEMEQSFLNSRKLLRNIFTMSYLLIKTCQ